MNKLLGYSLLAMTSLALSGCETADDRKLAAGQACLDSATSSNALQCKSLVDGLNSAEASMIRCSANFVSQGLTGSKIAESISKIKDSSGTVDGTTGMIAYLIFPNASPSADVAIADCTAAGSKAMLRLATATKLATLMAQTAQALGGAAINPNSPTLAQDMQNAVNSIATGSPSAAQLQAIGNTAITASQAYCGDGSSYVGTDVCNDLKAAVDSSSDPATIAQLLLNKMKK